MHACARLQYNKIPGTSERFSSLQKSRPACYSMGTQGAVPPGVKCLECEADHPPPSSGTVNKNERSCACTLPHAFKAQYCITHSDI